MDIRAGRGYNSNQATRKPLQDTTSNINNYSLRIPVHDLPKPQSTCDGKPQHRYNTQGAPNNISQSEVVSSVTGGRDPQYSATGAIAPHLKHSKLRKDKARVGPWLLGRTLGRGSSGRVRLAKHIETGRLAAIKIVGKGKHEKSPHEGQAGDSLTAGLEREVVIMKLIDHPNVMRLLDVWENSSELYLVLEYIEGGELFDHLTKRGRLPEDEAIRYFRQIMSGIDYCQHFNICHRDLKPENLLLDAENNIKIADFGMAALQPYGSLLTTPCGSPHYASPEIVSGKRYDGARSDIWSCGIVLFALLAGRLPFDHDNTIDVLQKVMLGRFEMPSEFSNEAQDLLWRMLTVDPRARITMEQIWKHPLVKRHAVTDPETKLEMDRGPRPPNPRDIGRPVRSRVEIDREILKNLQTLWQGVREKELIERLLCNVYNQEKVFYYLLMKYHYEHPENYPGNEPTAGYKLKQDPPQRKPSAQNQQWANNPTYHNTQHEHREGSLVPQCGHRQQIKGDDCATRPKFEAAHLRSQADHPKAFRGKYAHVQATHQQLKPYLKKVTSRSSLAASVSVRYGNGSSGRRCYSKSSLVSYISTTPSTYKSVKTSRSYKRQISFKHHNSRNARGDNPNLTIRNGTKKGVWDDAEYREYLDREYSPKFEKPEPALPPRGRRGTAGVAKRRSTVVIDGLVLDRCYPDGAQSLKTPLIVENEDAEKRRIASKELEEVCERAFNGCAVSSSFATLSTVKSIGHTANENISTIGINTTSHRITRPSSNQSIYTSTPSSTENNPPSDDLARGRSDARSALRIFQDEENNTGKGCFDDVIEHLDRLMDSSSKLRSIEKLRPASHGGIPLGFERSPLDLGDTPTMMKQYLDEEERDHQRYLVARATLRNVSTPNPQRIPTMDRVDPQNKESVTKNTAPEPALLNVRPKSALRGLIGTPRSETRNTIRAVDEVLQFDTPMPTPELRLPIDLRNVQNDGSRVADGDKWDSRLAEAIEPATTTTSNVANEPKKKRSLMDIFTGKKNTKTDKNKDKSGNWKNLEVPDTPGTFGTSINPSADVLDSGKGTFGRRSGNVLRRFVSRDAKKQLGLADDPGTESGLWDEGNMALNSVLDGGNPLSSCFSPGGYLSDEEVPTLENQDEFARVMDQRNWLQRVLNVRPASRVVYCNISALQCRREILKLYKDWLKHGLVIVKDDRSGLVLRARVGNPNTLNIKGVTFVGEIRTYNGTKKTGSSVVQFTQEKGAASSFNRIIDEITLSFSSNGFLIGGEHN